MRPALHPRMMTAMRVGLSFLLLAFACLGPLRSARGDAVVRTTAMSATTIVEFHIEPGVVTAELEIGLLDLAVFADLLPDESFEVVTGRKEPAATRHTRFFAKGLVLRAEDGEALPGRVSALDIRPRIRRDEITGAPLPPGETKPERVVVATLRYEMPARPARLTFAPPGRDARGARGAQIGFVAYHRGVAVNDFRYLAAEEVLDLDWDDAWFSRFRNPNLRRTHDAPIAVYLYVDALDVRLEVIARPRDLQAWTPLGVDGLDTIPVAIQEDIKTKAAAFLATKLDLTFDGTAVRPRLERVHFVRRTLRQTGVVDPAVDLPAASATLGVIFVHPIDALPQRVESRWSLFPAKFPTLPAAATDEAGPVPATVSPDDPVLAWQNFLKKPRAAGLVPVPPATPRGVPLPISAALAFLLAWLAWRARHRLPTARFLMPGTLLAGVLLLVLPFGWTEVPLGDRAPAAPSASEASGVLSALLSNTYHAFEFREDERIHDTLARSVDGPALRTIYVDTARRLALENQGGARVTIRAVEVLEATPEPRDGRPYAMRCSWRATGRVGHFGHVHERVNRYAAVLDLVPVGGVWKIGRLEVHDEVRE